MGIWKEGKKQAGSQQSVLVSARARACVCSVCVLRVFCVCSVCVCVCVRVLCAGLFCVSVVSVCLSVVCVGLFCVSVLLCSVLFCSVCPWLAGVWSFYIRASRRTSRPELGGINVRLANPSVDHHRRCREE